MTTRIIATLARKLVSVLLALSFLAMADPWQGPEQVALAANTGFQSPTANAATTGGDNNGFESNPSGAHGDGGGVALNENGPGDRHLYLNFGLTTPPFPGDIVITGIEVRLDGWADQAANGAHYDVELSWDAGNSWTAVRSTPTLTASETTYTLGGPNDLWGEPVWGTGDFTNANFRLRITSVASGTGSGNRDFSLDYVAVRVHYAAARITGVIWSDDNPNGTQDTGEGGLNNVQVTVYRDDEDGAFEGGTQDILVGSDTTDATGLYETGPFLEGYSYWVDVTPPANRTLTTPPEPRLELLAASTQVNFGYAPGSASPAIDIAKSPDNQIIVSGSDVTFTIAVTNTGNVALSGVTVADPLTPNCNRAIGSLAISASQTYTCSLASVNADFTNTATVTGTAPGNITVTDSDTAFVDVVTPAIDIAKTPDNQTIVTGQTATFSIAVTNTGNVALQNVVVGDALAPDCNRTLGVLNPSQNQTYTCSETDVTADFTNTAIVTGTVAGNITVSDSDTAFVDVVGPAVNIAKSPDQQLVTTGGTAVFTITVTNSGDIPLTNISVSDPLAPDCARAFSLLNPGQSQPYVCQQTNVTASFTNTATVTCSSAGGPVTDADTARVVVVGEPGCPASVLAYLRLDEPSGPSYADVYGAHPGACSGECAAAAAGRVNGGQAFNGSTTGIDIAPASGGATFNGSANDSFTIEFWMKANAASSCNESNEVIVGRTEPTLNLLQWWVGISCSNGGRAAFVLKDKSGTTGSMDGTTIINDGAWHHIVAVRDGASNQTRLYVDSRQEATTNVTYLAGFDSLTAPLNIGWFNRYIRYAYDGTLDELAIYNRALTPQEIFQHYLKGGIGNDYCAADVPLVPVYLPIISKDR